MNTIKKYKWKLRILIFETDSRLNKKYLKAKKLYESNKYEFHIRYVKLKTIINPKVDFKIKFIGFDGTIKKEYYKLDVKGIFKMIDDMPMGYLRKKIKPTNLSLYEDYNPKTTISGLGYKNKTVALETIKVIKNMSLKYQVSVVSTMLGRAKNHPHQTSDMREAIKVFEKWLNNYHKNKKISKYQP